MGKLWLEKAGQQGVNISLKAFDNKSYLNVQRTVK